MIPRTILSERTAIARRTLTAVLTLVAMVLVAGAIAAPAAAQTEDADFPDTFGSDNSTERNNVTITGGQLEIQRANLSWDVENLTWELEEDLTGPGEGGAIENVTASVRFGRNGTRMFILDTNFTSGESYINRYSTSNYEAEDPLFLDRAELPGMALGMDFSTDGRFLTLVMPDGTNVTRYRLTDKWRPANGLTDAGEFDTSFLANQPHAIEWSPAGEHAYLIGPDQVTKVEGSEIAPWFPTSLEASVSWPTGVESPHDAQFQDHNTNLNFTGLNSGDYVTVPDSSSLDVTGDITLALEGSIPRSLDVDGNNNYRAVLAKPSAVGDYGLIFEEGGLVDFTVRKGGTRHNLRACTIPMNGAPFTLVATHDTSTGESVIYKNGTVCSRDTFPSGAIDTNNNALQLSNQDPNRQLLGQIDRVRVDATEWSQSQAETYHAGGEVTGTDRRLEFDLDQGNGTTAIDTSGNDNHGNMNFSNWLSGKFQGAGDRLFVLDNKGEASAGNEEIHQLGTGGDYQVSSLTLEDSAPITFVANDDKRSFAWAADDGGHVVVAGCCNTGLHVYDAGYRPGAYIEYQFNPGDQILQERLNWSGIGGGGSVEFFAGVRDGVIGQKEFRNVTAEENVWQDFSAQNFDRALVRINLSWTPADEFGPSVAFFHLAVDTNDATGITLTHPTEMGLNSSESFSVCVNYENGTCQDRTATATTTVNRTDVLEVFPGNGTLRSNTNSGWVALNSSLDEDGNTFVANESLAVFGNRLQDWNFLEDAVLPIVIFTDWGWAALLVVVTMSALVAREVGIDVGVITIAVGCIFLWLLGFVGLEVAIFSVILAGVLVGR